MENSSSKVRRFILIFFFKNVSNFHKKFNAKTPRLFSPFVKLLFPLVFVAKDQHELRKRRFVKKWKCNKKTNFSTNWCTSTYHYVLCNISNNLMNSELLICFLEKYCKKNSDWKSIRMYHFYFEFIQFFFGCTDNQYSQPSRGRPW